MGLDGTLLWVTEPLGPTQSHTLLHSRSRDLTVALQCRHTHTQTHTQQGKWWEQCTGTSSSLQGSSRTHQGNTQLIDREQGKQRVGECVCVCVCVVVV